MTQKRFKKLLMGEGISRYMANLMVDYCQRNRRHYAILGICNPEKTSYAAEWRAMMKEVERV